MKAKSTNIKKQIRVAIYCRVSTLEQANRENSIDAQIDRCKRLIALHEPDWVEHDIYADKGFSGGSFDRPSLKDLIQDAKAGAFDVVAVFKLDRLTRNIRDFHKIWELFDQHNVSLVAASQEINTQTASGRLMVNMLVSFAEFERELIKERTSMAMDHKFRSGEYASPMGGRSPFGYRYDKAEKQYFIVESEAIWVRQMFEWFLSGVGLNEIAARLNAQGVRTRERIENSRQGAKKVGGNTFTIMAVKGVLMNPIHIGKLQFGPHIREATHEPILDRKTRDRWDVEVFEKLSPKPKGSVSTEDDDGQRSHINKWGLLFKGILFDEESGQALTPAPSGNMKPGGSEPHLYYETARDRKVRGQKAARYPARRIEEVALLIFEQLGLISLCSGTHIVMVG